MQIIKGKGGYRHLKEIAISMQEEGCSHKRSLKILRFQGSGQHFVFIFSSAMVAYLHSTALPNLLKHRLQL